jgi:phospholipase C
MTRLRWLIPLLIAAALGLVSARPVQGQSPADPEPNTPIRHVIVLMQENHTFDNYFGTYPGADGFPEGLCIPVDPFDPTVVDCVEPFHLGDQPIQDLDHSRRTFRLQFNEGRMDGFIHALDERNQDGALALGYYDDSDLPYYWNLANEYVLFDRFFSSAAAGSFMNHVFWVSASPGAGRDRPTLDGLPDMPTIFDRLEERGISWKYYIQKYDPEVNYKDLVEGAPRPPQVEWVPLLSMDRYLDDPDLFSRIADLDDYYDDLRGGTLPAVSFIKIIGASEHPPGNLLAGQRATRVLIQALMQSDAWPHSAFILTYDDWGGWYDHVPPPQVDEYGYGFRVPTLLVSPYAPAGRVDSTTLDYTSILKFIELNWDLEPLTTRDALANSIGVGFDFSQPPRTARLVPVQRYVGSAGDAPNPALVLAPYIVAGASALGLIAWPILRSGKRSTGAPPENK